MGIDAGSATETGGCVGNGCCKGTCGVGDDGAGALISSLR